jgi:hypothetical protein
MQLSGGRLLGSEPQGWGVVGGGTVYDQLAVYG